MWLFPRSTIAVPDDPADGLQMATMTLPTPPLITRPVSIARLHGEACWHCGATARRLFPCGTVRTPVDSGVREWPVMACGEHRSEPLS